MVNLLVLAGGAFLAVGFILSEFHAKGTDVQNVLAAGFGILGTMVSGVLGACGFTIVLVLGIIVMVKGAALRGILVIAAFFGCVLLSVGMVAGGVLYQVKYGKPKAPVTERAVRESPPAASMPSRPPAAIAPRPPVEPARPTPRPAPRLPKGETTLTNQKGQSFSGRIFGVTDWDVLMKYNGQELILEIKTLDAASQEKVRRWKAGE